MEKINQTSGDLQATAVNQEWNTHKVQARATWLRVLTTVHWISSALCLVAMFFFAVTGITLNNAGYFESQTANVTQHSTTLPVAMLALVNAKGEGQDIALPDEFTTWVRSTWGVVLSPKSMDWRSDEVFIDLKRPGVDAWLSIDRRNGAVQYQSDDHGWVAYFNDLHKGKNAGSVWSWFLNIFGFGALVFSLSGLLILQVHAKSRWSIWPITGLGLVLPLLAVLLFVH